MDKIIKLYGKITGISNCDSGEVKIRLLCTEYAVKESNDPGFDEFEYCQKNLCVPYSGPARLSPDIHKSLGLDEQVVQSTVGVGSLVEDLFVDDMVVVYVGYKKVAEKAIIEHVIVSQYGDKKTIEMSDFIMVYA